MLRRNFHAIAIVADSLAALQIPSSQPMIIYANHPSWWDPLLAQFLCRQLFPQRRFFAPIDAKALEQYRVFARLGFYGVQLDSASGSAAFLRTSRAIMAAENSSIWLTPEGRFSDPRDLDQPLAPGLAHLCSKADQGIIVPLALEYPFWDERLPECLLCFGPPLNIAAHRGEDKPAWSARLAHRLRETQRRLAEHVIARDCSPFQLLLRGHGGAGGGYDWMRRMRALLTRRPLPPQHGKHFQ